LKSTYMLILDVEPLHITGCFNKISKTTGGLPTCDLTRLGTRNATNYSLFFVLQVFIRKQETVQTVKLTLDHRVTPTSAIYRR